MRVPLAIVVVLSLAACSTVDLRPDAAPTAADRQAGATMLRNLAEAHGGRTAWLRQGVIRVEMKDRWRGVMHALAGPWPRNGTPFRLTFLPGSDNGRLEFLEVERPDWGIQNWKTYKVKDGETRFRDSGKLAFWIPTTIYFVEAPFRMLEATTVYRMSPQQVNGRTYERVFATWGTDAPQDDTDQYVVWVDAETGELAWLQYTVRDYAGWMMGIMAYTDYEDVGGFRIARTMMTVKQPGSTKRTLHEYGVDSVELNVDVDPHYVVPRPALTGSKH